MEKSSLGSKSSLVGLLVSWYKNRIRRSERLKIYDLYSEGKITREDYTKQRRELEERYKKEDGTNIQNT